ncbi:hypothetical protein Lpar_1259 [Legionella parisiensis]|uniref:Uncharacterized protein n=1 Tax=Legionella parisiensis TaxID=45071 RepID=A0A1E5JNT0_9GAMM|nr:hypothetical protein Lpar_1259 [Legionella parisiensis]OEH46197.1 hypothetical protein lpari_02814 [Legionella parisiensis]STX77514.1 Uncharacterised protein [Legionella parisiensis]
MCAGVVLDIKTTFPLFHGMYVNPLILTRYTDSYLPYLFTKYCFHVFQRGKNEAQITNVLHTGMV